MASHGCREDAQAPPMLVKQEDDGAFLSSATQDLKDAARGRCCTPVGRGRIMSGGQR